MKRLLCIIGGMNSGGAETFLMKVYRKLDKQRFQMDFAVAITEEGIYDKEIIKLGGKIYKIVPKSESLKQNFMGIKKLVRDNCYNSVLRISQSSLSALELLAAKKGGAKIRIFRSSNSNTVTASFSSRIIHKICAYMPKRYANVKVAPSSEAARFMFGNKEVEKGNVSILHNGVDLNVFKYDKEGRDDVRKEFNVASDCLLVGHVGRFMSQKNHEFLIRVFKKISEYKPNAKLMLVGAGELEQNIKEQTKSLEIEDKVIFTGVRSDIPSLLSAMDVFVFPSLYEGMPNTVIEAQATGLPCVIADTITKEADITGLVKYLSLSSSIEEWANVAIDSLSTERKETKNDFIKNKYDIESVVKEFTSLVFNEKE